MQRVARGRTVAGVPISVIVTIELLLGAVLLAGHLPGSGATAVMASAALFVALTFAPIGGVRPATWAALGVAFGLRRRVLSDGRGYAKQRLLPADTEGAARVGVTGDLRAIFADLSVRECEIRVGSGGDEVAPLGLVQWQGRWTAMLEITNPGRELCVTGPPTVLPADRVLAAVADYEGSIEAVQISQWSLAAQPTRLTADALVRIAGELARVDPPARHREVIVAVRINPVSADAAILARGGGVAGVGRLAAAALSRVRSEAFQVGLRATALDGPGAIAAMADALLEPLPASDRPARWIETWGDIGSGQVVHRSFVVTSWGPGSLDQLAGVPGYGLTITHEALWRPAGGSFAVVTLLRLSALSVAELDASTRQLVSACRRAGLTITRQTGRQASALRMSIPGGRR